MSVYTYLSACLLSNKFSVLCMFLLRTDILYSMLSMTSWTLDSDPKTEREMLRMRQKAKTILRKTVTTHTVNKGDDLAEGSQEEREGKVQSSEPPEFEIDVENFTVSLMCKSKVMYSTLTCMYIHIHLHVQYMNVCPHSYTDQ